MENVREIVAVVIHAIVLSLAAMCIAAVLIFWCITAHAGEEWVMTIRYVETRSGEIHGVTTGFGFASKQECEVALHDALEQPTPNGLQSVGACVPLDTYKRDEPESYTVPEKPAERCACGFCDTGYAHAGSGGHRNPYVEEFCANQVSRVSVARFGDKPKTAEQMESELAAWLAMSAERGFDLQDWLIAHERGLIASAYAHDGEPAAWVATAFDRCLITVQSALREGEHGQQN